MEVTSKNFKDILRGLEKDVNEATFLAIDGEFTGLNGDVRTNLYDTLEERYMKLRNVVEKFAVVQFGLCCFFHNKVQRKYSHKTFNFYISPQSLSSHGHERVFSCQASSVCFLASEGFDFTKLFKEGVQYLTPEEEDDIRSKLLQKQNDEIKQNESPHRFKKEKDMCTEIPDEQRQFISDVLKQVEEFVATEDSSIQLSPCSGFQRKLIYESLKKKYPSGLDMETQHTESERFIVVRKATEDEVKKRLQEKHRTQLQELEDAVGFSKVIKLISQSGKLLVGHNMLLDIMHMVNRFICHLPQSYIEFKELLSCTFPQILDTKVLSSSELFKDVFNNTVLNTLLNQVQMKPFNLPVIEAAEGFGRYTLKDRLLHEAGYDAFITGVCLIGMCEYLGKSSDGNSLPGYSSFKPYINKCFLMSILDIPYVNFAGDDIIPDRQHVYHISFPREWNANDIREAFYPYGPIQINWLNDTSAFVALRKPEQAENVSKMLAKQRSEIYKIRSYADYKRKQSVVVLKSLPVPQSDIPVPGKRKRNAPKATPNRSIEPIPEEEETEEIDLEPKAKKVKNHVDKEGNEPPAQKLFEEVDDWS